MLLKNCLVVNMNNEEFEKKLNQFTGKEVLMFDKAGYVFMAQIHGIKKNKAGLYKIDEYDHLHDFWFNRYINHDEVVEIKRYERKEKIGYNGIKNE